MRKFSYLFVGLALAGCASTPPYQSQVDQTYQTLGRWQASQVNAAQAIFDCGEVKDAGYKNRYEAFQKCGYPKSMEIVRASGFPYMTEWANMMDGYGAIMQKQDKGIITKGEGQIEGARLVDAFSEKKRALIQQDILNPLQSQIQAYENQKLMNSQISRQRWAAALGASGRYLQQQSQQRPAAGFQNFNCNSYRMGAYTNTNCNGF